MDRLISLALIEGNNLEIPIAVVSGNVTVIGRIASPEAYADHVDAVLDASLENAPPPSDLRGEDAFRVRDAWREALRVNSYRSQLDEWRKRRKKLSEQLELYTQESPTMKVEGISSDQQREWILTEPRHVALEDAVVWLPSGETIEVEYVRVDLRHVSGWWLAASMNRGEPSEP